MLRDSRSALLLSAVLLLAAFVTPGAVAGADGPATTDAAEETAESFAVDLAPDGDATVTLTLTYDLTDSDDKAAFESLQERSGNITTQFTARLSRVAERTADETGREMAVSDVQIGFESADGVRIVRLSARWRGLAAVDGETLTVTEPFASGFSADRPLTVSAPDGYEITGATPSTTERDGSTATWDAGTVLGGFEFTAEASDTDHTESVPGFGTVVAVIALLGGALIARHR